MSIYAGRDLIDQVINGVILFPAKTVILACQLHIPGSDSQAPQDQYLAGRHRRPGGRAALGVQFAAQNVENLPDILFRGISVKRKFLAKQGKMDQTFHLSPLKYNEERMLQAYPFPSKPTGHNHVFS